MVMNSDDRGSASDGRPATGSPLPSALKRTSTELKRCAGVSGRSPAMRRLLSDLEAVAPSDVPVLFFGESGTGKERCAKALHRLSPHCDGPLVAVRCRGRPAADLARELHQQVPSQAEAPGGAIHQARGGTLLLDDVDALELDAQTELLHALAASLPSAIQGEPDQRSRRRLPAPRLVATASSEIMPLVRRGRFRRELFHRIAVVRMELPPLRARRDDVPLLAAELLEERVREVGRHGLWLSPDAVSVLRNYPWPGNVRELRNVIWHAALRARDDEIRTVHVEDLLDAAGAGGRIEIALGTSLAAAEREIIRQTLAALGGNKKRAAETLVIARRTLYLKLRQDEGG